MARTFGRKVAFGFAVASFVSTAASLAFFVYLITSRGVSDVITASLFAVTVFFLSCGMVLYFISKPPRHELQPWDSVTKTE
jgi:hypothetical protein